MTKKKKPVKRKGIPNTNPPVLVPDLEPENRFKPDEVISDEEKDKRDEAETNEGESKNQSPESGKSGEEQEKS